jgi:hypothetical protein
MQTGKLRQLVVAQDQVETVAQAPQVVLFVFNVAILGRESPLAQLVQQQSKVVGIILDHQDAQGKRHGSILQNQRFHRVAAPSWPVLRRRLEATRGEVCAHKG